MTTIDADEGGFEFGRFRVLRRRQEAMVQSTEQADIP
jgi:hypothetical protein